LRRRPVLQLSVRPRITALNKLVVREVAHFGQRGIKRGPWQPDELDACLVRPNSLNACHHRIERIGILQPDDVADVKLHVTASNNSAPSFSRPNAAATTRSSSFSCSTRCSSSADGWSATVL